MKKLISVFFCLFFVFVAFSQTYNLRTRLNHEAAQYGSTLIKDSFIYCSGIVADTAPPYLAMNVFSKYDLAGNLIYHKPFYGDSAEKEIGTFDNAFIHTNDGGFALTGYVRAADYSLKCLLIKYDSAGMVNFYKTYTYPSSQTFLGYRLIEDATGFYIQGTIQYANYDVNLFVIKTDIAGNEQWRRFYGSNSTDELSSAFIKTKTNKLLIAATKNNKDYSHDATFQTWSYLLLLDLSGNIISDTVGIDSNVNVPQCVIETKDGGFAFCTCYALFKTNAVGTYFKGYTAKVDTNFNVLWEKMYGDSSPYTLLYNISETPSGDLIMTGTNYNDTIQPYYYQHQNGLVVKTDASGNQLWSREYRGVTRIGQVLERNILYDSEILSDGSIVACGVAQDDNDTFPQRAWLLRIDANGCMDNSWCGYTEIEKPIQQNSKAIEVNIYPNPFSSNITLTIQSEAIKETTITVRNLLAQKVFETKEENRNNSFTKTINLNSLPSGIYFFEVSSNNIRIVKEIVKE